MAAQARGYRAGVVTEKKKKKYDELTVRLKPPSGPELKCVDWHDTPTVENQVAPLWFGEDAASYGRIWSEVHYAVNPRWTLPQISQGAAGWQRNGRQVLLKKISANLSLTYGTGIKTLQDVVVRVIIVIDFQTNGVTNLSNTNLLKESNQEGETRFMTQRNMDNSTRFKTLVDELIRLDDRGKYYIRDPGNANPPPPQNIFSSYTWDQSGVGVHRQYYFRMNLPITYTGATGDAAELATNSIRCYVTAVTTAGLEARSVSIVDAWDVRCRFTDA